MELEGLISLYEYKDNDEAVLRIYIAALMNKIELYIQSTYFDQFVKLEKQHVQLIRSMHPKKAEVSFKLPLDEDQTRNIFFPDTNTQLANFTDLWAYKIQTEKILNQVNSPQLKLNETERNYMLKLILGMAVTSFGFNPHDNKNLATGNKPGSIKAELSSIGLAIDEDTIRKYLKEAKGRYPYVRPREIKNLNESIKT
ncbi:hypothetical protein [Candidatus Berkiella aquae]|uniref:Uncharacterized protein n=1 Tax=Candidatus Berkiella aquae TaxID=295108 RepID=A0A0Q9YXR1_9GAMM|nr:hypothetical protein [Candidatus Berkiella aquae]MCS5711457.1 hypothetical protein [Candidatus Berkiella aquae]